MPQKIPFATSADLILQYDVRRICELVSDTGVPVSSGSLSTNVVVTYCLQRATETILMNARLGKRYTEDELVYLATDPDGLLIGSELRGLCCDLAYGYIVMRRGTGENDVKRLSPNYFAAQQTLQLLARGEFVFAHTQSEAQIAAGTPETFNMSTAPTAPQVNSSWSQQVNLGLLPVSPFVTDQFNSIG